MPPLPSAKNGRPIRPDQDVERDAREPAPEAERAADEEDAERLAGDRHGRAGSGIDDQGGQR